MVSIVAHPHIDQQSKGDGNNLFGVVNGNVTINQRDGADPIRLPLKAARIAGLDLTKLPPSKLVHPRFCPVDLVGRDGEIGDLLTWASDPEPLSVRIIGGQGGSGKTRLGLQLCRILSSQGWGAGLLELEADEHGLRWLTSSSAPRLVVVDYAENRGQQLERLLEMASGGQSPEAPLRILLLARRTGSDGTTVSLGGPPGDLTEILLHQAAPPLLLDRIPLDGPARADLYQRAQQSFLGQPDAPVTRQVDLESDVFSIPLMVLIAALPQVAAESLGTGPSRKRLLDALLEHEQRHWTPIPEGGHRIGRKVIAATTLSPTHDKAATATMLQAVVADFEHRPASDLYAVAEWANENYPTDPTSASPTWVAPLEPDLVGEHLIAEALAVNDGEHSFTAALRADESAVARSLIVIERMVADRPELTDLLQQVLKIALPSLAELARDQTDRTRDAHLLLGQDLINAALLRLLRQCQQLDPDAVEAAAALFDGRSQESFALAPLVAELGAIRVGHDRERATISPAHVPDLARSLNNLSNRLGELGRTEEGLAAITEAVEIRRRLAEAQPAAYLPDLAGR